PRLAAVGGLVDAVAGREIGTLKSLAAADVDDVGIRRRNRDGADRARRLVVEDRRPRASEVVRLPDTAVDRADVEDVWLIGNAHCGLGAAGPMRTDHAPAHLVVHARIDPRCLLSAGANRGDDGKCENQGATKRSHDVLGWRWNASR